MPENFETHLLIDEEASPEQLQLIRDNLSKDPKAQQEYEFYAAMKAKLGTLQSNSSFDKADCDRHFKTAMGKVGRMPESQKAEKFVTKYAFAFAGALMFFIIGSGISSRQNVSRNLSSSDVSDVSTMTATSSSMSWNQLGDWFNSKLGKTPIDTSQQTWTITSAMEGSSKKGRFARVNFQDSKGTFWLLVMPNTPEIEGMRNCSTGLFKESMFNGVRCVCWTSNGSAFAVVGDRSTEELQSIAKLLRQ